MLKPAGPRGKRRKLNTKEMTDEDLTSASASLIEDRMSKATSTMLHLTPEGKIGFEPSLFTTDYAPHVSLPEKESCNSQLPIYDDMDDFDYPFASIGDEDEPTRGSVIQLEEEDRKRTRIKPTIDWCTKQRSRWLDNMIWTEGRGGYASCCFCGNVGTLYRCRVCLRVPIVCASCLLERHADAPLHQVEKWVDTHWKREALFDIGLIVQLGHYKKESVCNDPVVSDVLVVDVYGFHYVKLSFCGCTSAPIHSDQLMRIRWFPASDMRPKTAFTYAALDHFCELSVQGKLSVHDYYNSIVRFTNGTGEIGFTKRYDELLRAVRWYQNLLNLKRGGRAHDPLGIEATKRGELGLDCPSCPHPEKNIPPAQEIPFGDERKYSTILAMDCCFRLNEKDRHVKNDPELSPGWAYTVDHDEYHGEIDRHPEPDEKSTCASTHSAIENASRIGNGLLATGVGGIVCARSGMLRPNSVGDLRQGERYVYMDLLLLHTLLVSNVLALTLSYDICCQWSRHFTGTRLAHYPKTLTESILAIRFIIYVVAKMHLVAHGIQCQAKHSLNFRRLSARTDGESIERAWAHIGVYAGAQREMGPGFRRDSLNFHWAAFNYGKIVGLGDFLLRKLKEAIPERDKQNKIYADTTNSFSGSDITRWSTMIEEWHKDPYSKPDPFHEPEVDLIATRALQGLLESGKLEVEANQLHISGDKPSKMISEGMAIQEDIRLLNAMVKKSSRDESDEATESKGIQEKRLALQKKLDRWWSKQIFYMPIVATLLTETSSKSCRTTGDSSDFPHSDIRVENTKVYLPSSLTPTQRSSLPGIYRLVEKECLLRFAEALAALQTMKKHLMTRSSAYCFKRANIRGQVQNTRAHAILKTISDKVNRSAVRYRAARTALLSLAPHGLWEEVLLPLNENDIKSPKAFDITDIEKKAKETKADRNARKRAEKGGGDRIGQKKETFSWIWRKQRPLAWRDIYPSGPLPSSTVIDPELEKISVGLGRTGDDDDDKEFDTTLRVAWSRLQARAEHWNEEVELLLEEMRRTLAYHDWKAEWWKKRVSSCTSECQELAKGLKAHCMRQASTWERRAERFAATWAPYLRQNGITARWPDKYMVLFEN